MKLYSNSTKYLSSLLTILVSFFGWTTNVQAAVLEEVDLANHKFSVMLPDNMRSFTSVTENRQLPANIKGWTTDSVQVYVALIDKNKTTQFFSNLSSATNNLGFFNPVIKTDDTASRNNNLYLKYYQQPTAIGSLDFKLYSYFINEINASRPMTKITQMPLRNLTGNLDHQSCSDYNEEGGDNSAAVSDTKAVKAMTVGHGENAEKNHCKRSRLHAEEKKLAVQGNDLEQQEKELSYLTRTFVGSRFYHKRDTDQDLFNFWLTADKKDALLKDIFNIPVVRLTPFNDQVEYRLVKLNGKPAIRVDANVINITREYRGNYQFLHALTQDYSSTQYLVAIYYYFNEQIESRNNVLDSELFLQSVTRMK